MEPLFLKPVFKERIWGGTALEREFGYHLPEGDIGECWAISAHPNGPSVVANGPFKGISLDELWKDHPELFGYPEEEKFPLLTKILDANADLSVQVHPDDTYAKEHENGELGKTECWYIIDCEDGAEMIMGHNAKSKENLAEMIDAGRWDDLLRRVKIKPGDFYFVPSGTIHALCKGTLVLETQQSSDTTYRVYDYSRRDADGNLRELHLDKAMDVTNVPHSDPAAAPAVEKEAGAVITKFIESPFFTVYNWDIEEQASFSFSDKYVLMSVLDGEGRLEHKGGQNHLKKGDHLILPAGFGNFTIQGNCKIIASHT